MSRRLGTLSSTARPPFAFRSLLFSVISNPTISMKSGLEQQPDVYRKIIIAKGLKWEMRDKLIGPLSTSEYFFQV
ncbi:hypothetical protein [Spirosoma aerolatum]|uniref:hypothetical protein n=1 Tax=Spirosoma aerolatum TaxID=1211326 RepID=UPI0015D000BF|nr:hypothetical protein [Spirosoma aerolatum]